MRICKKYHPGQSINPDNPDSPHKPRVIITALNQQLRPGEFLKQEISQVKIEGLPRSVSLNAMTLSSGFTDAYQVGYTTITVSGASLVDVSGNDVTTDYEIEYQPGELKVFPEDIWIHGVKGSFSYTGKKIIQDFRLYDGEVLLEENKDYTVSYKNNVKAYEFSSEHGVSAIRGDGILSLSHTTAVASEGLGEGFDPKKAPALIIKMKGNYKGKHTIYFQIERRSLQEADLDDMTLTYTGKN